MDNKTKLEKLDRLKTMLEDLQEEKLFLTPEQHEKLKEDLIRFNKIGEIYIEMLKDKK